MNQDLTAIAVLVDRSGSMASIKTDAEGALNTFVDGQKKLDGEATIRISQFDDTLDHSVPSTDLKDAPKFTLSPRGMTALYDSLVDTIDDFGRELAAIPERNRPGKVLFIVITDGFENASHRHSINSVRAAIERQRNEYNWDFVFLAANQDAVLSGTNLGFAAHSSLTFTPNAKGVRATSQVLDTYAGAYRTLGVASFSDADRAATVDSNS